jgi:DNA replication regulator DPB11
VGRIDTAKYQYVAKERPDVKVLVPDWLEAVRDAWMEAEKVDVLALEQKHRTPTFWGLCICISGWQDLEERQAIIQTISDNGAEYRGNLTAVVSHLIVKEPTGKKYQWARENGVHVASYEWLTQSLERGMALDVSFFNPLMPDGMRGRGAWRRLEDLASPLRKRSRPDNSTAARADANRRKLRRTASAKIESQSASIWSDITGGISQPKPAADDDSQEIVPLEEAGSAAIEQPDASTLPLSASHSGARKPAPVGAFEGSVIYVHGFDARKV